MRAGVVAEGTLEERERGCVPVATGEFHRFSGDLVDHARSSRNDSTSALSSSADPSQASPMASTIAAVTFARSPGWSSAVALHAEKGVEFAELCRATQPRPGGQTNARSGPMRCVPAYWSSLRTRGRRAVAASTRDESERCVIWVRSHPAGWSSSTSIRTDRSGSATTMAGACSRFDARGTARNGDREGCWHPRPPVE